MQEKDNLLRILKETKIALLDEDSAELKSLSNQTINTASLTQDPDNIAVAVLVYALSKIVEREKYQDYPGWKKMFKEITGYIDGSISSINKNDEKSLRSHLTNLRRSIGKLSGRLRKYIQEVFRKALVNKASRIYEHGISMERTASLLGITMFELANYAGGTTIPDVKLCRTCDVKDRIKVVMDMFK